MLSLLAKPLKYLFFSNKNTDQMNDLDVNVLEKEYVIHPPHMDNIIHRVQATTCPKSNIIPDQINVADSNDEPIALPIALPIVKPIVLPTTSPRDIIAMNTHDQITERFYIEHLVDEVMKQQGLSQKYTHKGKHKKNKLYKQHCKNKNKLNKQKKQQQHKSKKQQQVANNIQKLTKNTNHKYNLRSTVKNIKIE
jgi:hypothetical protein